MDRFKHRCEVKGRGARNNPGGPRTRLSTGRSGLRRLRSTGFAGAVLAIVLAMPPLNAVASTVDRPLDDANISYVGDPGESNVLSISRAAASMSRIYFEDLGVKIGPTGSQAVVIGPNGQCARESLSLAWCPAVGVGLVTVLLRDLDDVLTVTDAATPGSRFR